ncbi:SH2B adapter protein 1-like isoform X1 [Vespula maculifrons]|uniref:SH2B adapter protein 1-like isoform X1 n=2 Tax=Vespula TaxID=7451 RepID=A0ABD2C1E0_VESSQ
MTVGQKSSLFHMVHTYGGSIRTRTDSLERLEQLHNIAEQQGSTSNTGRAVQNTLSCINNMN